MRGKIALISLIVGYLLHLVDIASDISVAVRYAMRGEWWWSLLTLFFVVLPVFIAIFLAPRLRSLCHVGVLFVQALRAWKKENWDNPPCGNNDWRCSCEACKSYHERRKQYVESTSGLAVMGYSGTIAESAPQWCLQNYVMLRQWYFPSHTVKKNKLRSYPTVPLYIAFFAWQLFGLLARLAALVIFAYAFRYYVFVVLGVHSIAILLVSYVYYEKYSNEELSNRQKLVRYLVNCLAMMFHISGSVSAFIFGEEFKYRKSAIFFMHVLLSVENIVIASLAVWAAPARATHMKDLKTIALVCVCVGALFSSIFMTVYYRCFHPSKLAQQNEENDDEGLLPNEFEDEHL